MLGLPKYYSSILSILQMRENDITSVDPVIKFNLDLVNDKTKMQAQFSNG